MDFLPLQTNLFPYWFFPWNTHSWVNFTAFVSHKELLAIDALRQIFVWKEYVALLVSHGSWPLWNPYNFSGQPLLANFQSSLFYPISWIFFFLPAIISWSVYIFVQPLIAGIGMYLFLSGRNISKIASLFGSIALVCCSFFATRYFWGVYLHPLIWIPFGLLLIDKLAGKSLSKGLFIGLLSVVLSLIILGGYPQHAVLALITITSYFFFRNPIKGGAPFLVSVVVALLICSAQLLPTYELYKQSPREQNIKIIEDAVVPAKYLSTILVPDLLGSPATNNYSGDKDYTGVNTYIGIVPLIFAVFCLFKVKNRETRFWVGYAVLGLFFSYVPFIATLPSVLKIPILSSGAPWNNLFIFQFGMLILAALGFETFLRSSKKFLLVIIMVVSALIILLAFANRDSTTAIRNSFFILSFVGFTFLASFLPKKFVGLSITLLMGISGLYFVNKISPWGEKRFFYPSHAVTSFLKNEGGYYRFWGMGGATLPTNLATHYKIYDPQGYDSLWPKWYGELLAATEKETVPSIINRAEARISEQDNLARKKLLNLLGVKYFLDHSETAYDSNPNYLKYPSNQFILLKRWSDISIYENKDVLPRVFLAESFSVAAHKDIPKTMFKENFPPRRILLEKNPTGLASPTTGKAEIIDYEPNQVTIKTSSPGKSLLFLSDTFFPGWVSRVNNIDTPIYQANYAFRAVVLPKGENQVVFSYEPTTFKIGLQLSVFGMVALGLIFVWPLVFRKRT